jgi:prephenate dehydratase
MTLAQRQRKGATRLLVRDAPRASEGIWFRISGPIEYCPSAVEALRRTKVAFQGERGAFSEEAARLLLGSEVDAVPHKSFEAMFDAVARGDADCAAVPIENSLAGSVYKNYDLLLEHDLTIIGEANLRISHNLITAPHVPLEAVRRVYSHPVALAQCERFLREHPSIEAVPTYDTAGSVKMIMERGRPDEGAIAGRAAASVHGAQVVAAGIESNPENFTRFLLLARPERAKQVPIADRGIEKKTSVVFRLKNRPGALFKALAVFALRDIDLTKIESRPIEGRPWEYSFYVDFVGDAADPVIGRALANLAEVGESVRILGSYPRAPAG